jgi:GH15 family glucan-1,4-alpha-glucosidase
VADHALPTGIFPEQIHPHTGEPLSVSSLKWSHAEFVDTLTDYVEKLERL